MYVLILSTTKWKDESILMKSKSATYSTCKINKIVHFGHNELCVFFSWWYRLIICKSSTNPLMGYNKDGIDSSSNYSKMMLPGKWCPAVAFYMMLFSGRARAVILLFKCNVS